MFWVVALMGIFTLSACSPPSSTSDKAVNELAQGIVVALQAGDVDKLVGYYDKNFYVTKSPKQWRAELTSLFSQHGKITNMSMRNKQADTRFSGKFYIFQFDTVHDDNKRAKHTLTIIRPVNSPEQVVIVGHHIKI